LKVIYIENDSKDKNLSVFNNFHFYEFEFILPRNLRFRETKTIIKKIFNRDFDSKIHQDKEKKIHIHYIKIIKKIKDDILPTSNTVKLVS